MPSLQIYQARDDDWATHVEWVFNEPEENNVIDIDIKCVWPSEFVLAVVSTPEGFVPPYLDAQVSILDQYGKPLLPDTYSSFGGNSVSQSWVAVVIHDQPLPQTSWKIQAKQGIIPFAVSAMAFHPPKSDPSAPPVTSPAVPKTSITCRICKSTAKALALAIVAAATLQTLPAALLLAVSSYLGNVGTIAAAAFINGVLGDTADVIAEKLCRRVRLCP